METIEKNPQFKLSIDTQTLIRRLETAEIGDVIAYHELTKLIDKDVQTEARGAMDSARRVLMREKQIVFDCIRGIGLLRLSDSQITETSATFVKQARKKADKGIKTLSCANYEKLTDDQRKEHNAGAAILGFIKMAGAAKNINKVKSIALTQSEPPKIEDLMGVFKK